MGQRVLLTGATGFVGQKLEPLLRASGHEVVHASRDPVRAALRFPGRDWRRCDVGDPASVRSAMEGCDAAFYLVHELRTGHDYPALEARQAHDFAAAARDAGVGRVIYLGGVAPKGAASQHLASRLRVGEILRAEAPLAIELRAAMIIGAGSASWQMVHDMSVRLPAMLLPAWTRFRSSPVAIDDVALALVYALELPLESSTWMDLPGLETMTHADMLLRVSMMLGHRPALLPVPVLTPSLSSYWVALVTRVELRVARELVQGLQSDLVPTGPSFWLHLPQHRQLTFEEAVKRACREMDERGAPIRGGVARTTRRARRALYAAAR
jgi:uncharacterized protein YbjT (DUF2867 family)